MRAAALFRQLVVRLRALFRASATEAELEEELQYHLDTEIARGVAGGKTLEQAVYAARRSFGNLGNIKDDARDTWRWATLERLSLNLRFAVRSFRRAPGFVLLATLSLGTALGLATTVFALIDSLTHPESPYRDVDRVAGLLIFHRDGKGPSAMVAESTLRSIPGVREVATVETRYSRVNAGGVLDQLFVARPLTGFFDLVGVETRLGRLPTAAETAAGNTALISDALWRRRFANRHQIGSTTITVDGRSYAVIGVLPPQANLLTSSFPDVWLPAPLTPTSPIGTPVLRLDPGIQVKSLYPSVTAIFRSFSKTYRTPNDPPFGVNIQSLRPNPLQLRDYHTAMVGAAIVVLLVACANVAALMLARSIVRKRDYALRIAIGAARGDIARDVLAEIVLLCGLGAIAGAVIALWGLGAMSGGLPQGFASLGLRPPQWSWRVLSLSGLALFVCVAVAGGYPAWLASRVDPVEPLKEASGGTTARITTRFRWLVMGELALAMMLTMGASLMLKSLRRMEAYDFGYDARGLLKANIRALMLRGGAISPTGRAEFDQALAEVRSLPGVRNAASIAPCNGTHTGGVVTTDRTSRTGVFAWIAPGGTELNLPSGCTNVSANFFQTLGLPIIDGRDFEDGDAPKGGAVVLDAQTARLLFPHERAVGHSIKIGSVESSAPWLPVVGVVSRAWLGFNPYPELGSSDRAFVFASVPQRSGSWMTIVMRPELNTPDLAVNIATTLQSVLPDKSFTEALPWVSDYEARLTTERYFATIFAMLGVVTLALACAGLFSVVSYVVNQRMREFAVRVALGARRENVVRLVMLSGLEMMLGGIALGAALGIWSGFLLWSLLYGMYPADVGALLGAEGLLVLAGMSVCLIPAVRAARANPVELLRAG